MELPRIITQRIIPTIKKQKTQELVIEYLYTLGYKFIDSELPKDSPPYDSLFKRLRVVEEHSLYSILVRKFPNGKWDTRLIILCKLLGKKEPYILIYLKGKYKESIRVPWKQVHNFKVMKIGLEFPDYMDYDERRAWRIEHTRLLEGRKKIPSEFYLQHKDNITILLPEKYGEKF